MAVSPSPPVYEAWNRVLAEEFFSRAHAGTPVILWVDRDTAEELAEKHGLDVSLADTVRSALNMASRSRAFGRISEWCERIHSVECPPPSLPLLAASVVAASMMASDGMIRASNFYVPFAKYLFGEDYTEDQHRSLRQSAYQLADLWLHLDRWLGEKQGQFGISTIKGHDHLTRIGFPISQAVLKAADRRALSQFFRDARLTPGKPVSPDYLERALEIWLRRHPKAVSSVFAAAYAHPDLTEFINELVLDCAHSWDGMVRDAAGGRRVVRLRVRLRMGRRDSRIGWAAEAVDGIDGGTVLGFDGEEHEFGHDYGLFYQGLDEVPFKPSHLTLGLTMEATTASGEKVAFVYQPSENVYFRQNRDLGWVSHANAAPFEDHMILVMDRAVPEMTTELREAGVEQPKHIKAEFALGWNIFLRIVFREESKFIKALGRRDSALKAVGVRGTLKPKLVGGLLLKQGLAQNLYLTGGSPDLLVDMRAYSERGVRLDFGDGRKTNVCTGGFPIPLTQEAASASGQHRVTVDGTPLSFELVDVLADGEVSGTGTVAFAADEQAENRASKVGLDVRAIRGALLPDGVEPALRSVQTFKNSSDRYLVSHDGHGHEPGAPELPVLYKKLGLDADAFYYADVIPPPGWSGWMIEWQSSIRVTPIEPRRPNRSEVISSPDREKWALAILDARGCSSDPIWQEYVALAEEICQ